MNYTYDSHGNRSSMTYPNGKTVSYSYDEMNRLIAVKGVDGETTKYEYDALGRRISTDGVKEVTVYAYDEVGNLTSQTTTGAYDLALEYAYDLSGRMTQESRTENGATLTSVFAYDPLGQLTSFTRSDGQSESYAYDPVGNMTAKTRGGVETRMTYNAANQLVSSVSGTDKTTYSYDANGNLTRSENAAGARSYAYNALNLLETFTREDGYSETYTYNTNRLLSEIRTSEDLTTTLTWDILYGDGVVISAVQNGQTTNFTYGLERISAITGRTRTEYVYDGRGSVAAEVSYNNAWYTFGGGLARKNVVSKSYSPFGELLTEQTSGFGYNGEYYNAATGMIYLRARFYEPEMNRFGQKDLLRGSAFAPQSLNRYLYCWNDPVNLIDPSGMRILDWGKNLVNKATNAWNTFTTGVKELIDVGQTMYYTLTDKPDPRLAANQPVDAISGAAPSVSHPVSTVPRDYSADTQTQNKNVSVNERGISPPTSSVTRDAGQGADPYGSLLDSSTQTGNNNANSVPRVDNVSPSYACDSQPSLQSDYVIYYYHPDSSKNMDYFAENNGYALDSSQSVSIASFDELRIALKSVPDNTNNIFIYAHGDETDLTFYYNKNYNANDILSEIPAVSIEGTIFLFSCHGANSIAPALAEATGQNVVACYQGVSFTSDGRARVGLKSLAIDIMHNEDIGWYLFTPDGFLYENSGSIYAKVG